MKFGAFTTGTQPAAIEIHHWFYSADTRLHYCYIGSMNYDLSFVVTVRVTCYSWAPSSGDHLFTWGAIYPPPHFEILQVGVN